METIAITGKRQSLLNEFIQHAPKMVCDFEKAISKKDKNQIIFLSKLNRTLFHQIGEQEIADEFDIYTSKRKINFRVVSELINQAKKLISKTEIELNNNCIEEIESESGELVICLDQIKSLQDSSENFTSELIEMYGQQNVDYLQLMNNAIMRSDFEKTRKIAHTMKSSFVMIGCETLKKIALKIESVCEGLEVNKTKLIEQFKTYDKLVKESIHLLKSQAKSENLL